MQCVNFLKLSAQRVVSSTKTQCKDTVANVLEKGNIAVKASLVF